MTRPTIMSYAKIWGCDNIYNRIHAINIAAIKQISIIKNDVFKLQILWFVYLKTLIYFFNMVLIFLPNKIYRTNTKSEKTVIHNECFTVSHCHHIATDAACAARCLQAPSSIYVLCPKRACPTDKSLINWLQPRVQANTHTHTNAQYWTYTPATFMHNHITNYTNCVRPE